MQFRNTRVVFTSAAPNTQTVSAGFETADQTTEASKFSNYQTGAHINTVATNAHGGSNSLYLNGGYAGQVGIGKSYNVYPGDQLNIQAYAKYNASSGPSNLSGFAAALLTAFNLATPAPGETGTAASAINTWGGIEAGGYGDGSTDYSDPRAFVNIVLFDKNYNFLDVTYAQLTSNGGLMTASYTVKEVGYAYLYVSNENSTLVDVYFDDVKMSYTPSRIIQSNEYYAHGLQTAKSWTRDNAVANNFLANGGTELNATTGLMDLEYRNFDPVLGRMHQVDPLADRYGSHSVYHYSNNNPISINDPSGAAYDPYGDWGSYNYHPRMDGGYHMGGGGHADGNHPFAGYVGGMWGDNYQYGGYSGHYSNSTGWMPISNSGGGIPGWLSSLFQVSLKNATTSLDFENLGGARLSEELKTMFSSQSQPGSDTDIPAGNLISLFLEQVASGNIYLRLVYETSNTSMVSCLDVKENTGARYIDFASLYLGGNRWGANGTVEGVNINNSNTSDLKYGAAYTTPWSGINLSYNYYGGRPEKLKDLVRHEFGHVLQYRRYGAAFYGVMATTSFISALISKSEAEHQRSWSESEANTLSYMSFGFPSNWNFDRYPINTDYMDAVIKTDFVKNFSGLGGK